ncbi:unnamed protein product, partial [Heterosigma akashiwo]
PPSCKYNKKCLYDPKAVPILSRASPLYIRCAAKFSANHARSQHGLGAASTSKVLCLLLKLKTAALVGRKGNVLMPNQLQEQETHAP